MSKRYPGGILRKTPPTPSQTSAQGIWDMASVTQAVKENTWPIAGVPDPISKSLRFRASASAYLGRTPTSVGNRRTWTFSTWIKLGEIAASNGTIFAAGTASGETTRFYLRYTGSQFQTGYGSQNLDTTSAVYRDPSAWYHLVLAVDTTQATAANRLKIYVNGVQQAVSTSVNYTQNVDTAVNNSVTHSIARDHIIPGGYFDGYLTETYLIDGQALTPSSFGSTNDQTGVWQPIAYTGTYGTNGFYLPFSNTASTTTLGYDFSGNSNNWTTNNISLTSGTTYDSMVDVPTQWIPYNTAGDTGALFRGNYCVLNPLASRSVGTMQNGNLTWKKSDAAGDNYCCASSISIPSSGKWYWEVTITDGASGANCIGIIPSTSTTQQTANTIPGDFGITTNAFGYYSDGTKRNSGSSTAYGNSFTTGDIIGVAVDTTNGKIWWSKNGTWQASGDPAAGTNAAFTTLSGSYYAASSVRYNGNQHDYNFGQRSFSYTLPSGFVTLNTLNLSTPTIGATASTQANDYFNATLYTGNNSTQSVTGVGFQPDFVWIKERDAVEDHFLFDSVRGATNFLRSNTTDAQGTLANYLTAFNSDGFSLGNGGGVNGASDLYVSWNWRASNATAVTNTAGSITSTVSANTTAGFSIVTYTGNGTNGATVGHGLGVSPSMIIGKIRSTTGDWYVWQTAMGDNFMKLNTTAAQLASTANGVYNTASFSSTVFALGSSIAMNASGGTFVAYCFAQVAGYSAFGSYTGNGSSDGPFIFTGFRPAFVLTKCSSTTGNWMITDDARNPSNLAGEILMPNNADTEYSQDGIDMLSNGFKLRASTSNRNSNGATYIYMAFAESPFKYALAR